MHVRVELFRRRRSSAQQPVVLMKSTCVMPAAQFWKTARIPTDFPTNLLVVQTGVFCTRPRPFLTDTLDRHVSKTNNANYSASEQ